MILHGFPISHIVQAAAVAAGDFLVTDIGTSASTTALLKINRFTGERAILSRNDTGSGTSFNLVADVAVTPTGVIYVTDTGSSAIRSVKQIDPSTGDRTVISGAGVGSGTDFAGAIRGIAWDPVDGTILVADTGTSTATTAVIRVDPSTGARSIVSRNDTGSGSSFNFINDVIVTPAGDIYVADASGANSSVKKIDRGTGNRTLVSGNGAGSGTAFSGAMRTVFWDYSTSTIMVADAGTSASTTALYRVDPNSGARTLLSRNDTGSGSSFTLVNAGVTGFDGALHALDANGANSSLRVIHGITGDRTHVSGSGAGSGTDASSEWRGVAVYHTLPAATQLTANNVGQSAAGQTSYSFTVQYSDDVGVDVSSIGSADVTVTGPSGAVTVVSGSESSGVDGALKTATYVITPPGGSWNDADNGIYTITLNGDQVADIGNLFAAGGSLGAFTVSMDTTAPGSPSTPDLAAGSDSGSSNTDNVTNDNTPGFSGSAEAGSTVRLFANGVEVGSGTATGGTWNITASSLSDGAYTFTATAADAAGNTSSTSGGLVATIDTQPPAVSIGSPSSALARGGPVTYTVTYTGASSISLSSFHVTVNTAGTAAANSLSVSGSGLTTRTVSLGDLTGTGTVGISVGSGTASDLAGNNAGAAGPSATFEVDNTPPSAPSISGISSDTGSSNSDGITSDRTLVFSGTGEPSSTVSVTRAGSGVIGSATVNGGGGWTVDYTGTALSDGDYSFTASASDAAGNVSADSSPFAVTVDNDPPAVSISAPSAAATAGASVTYTATYTGASAISLASGDIVLNSTGSASASVQVTGSGNERTVTLSSVSGDGTLGITIGSGTASDTAGNTAASAGPSGVFVVDTTNDPPGISGTEANQAVDDNDTVFPFANAAISDADQPAQSLTVQVALDSAAKGAFTTLNGFSDAGGGVYTFTGTATAATTAIRGLVFDPADNRGAPGSTETTTFTIEVDDGIAATVSDAATTVVSTSINDNPVAGSDSATRRSGAFVKISTAALLANDSDPEGRTLSVSLPSATSANGAEVRIEGKWVLYIAPVSDAADTFQYTLSDPDGGSAAGTVTVTVQASAAQTQNVLSAAVDGNDVVIRFAGIPGVAYNVEYTDNLVSPSWTFLGTATAGPTGLFEYRDVNPSSLTRFYRTFIP